MHGRTFNVPDTVLLKAKSHSFPPVGLFHTEQTLCQNTILKAIQDVPVSCHWLAPVLGVRSWWLPRWYHPCNLLQAGLPGRGTCRMMRSQVLRPSTGLTARSDCVAHVSSDYTSPFLKQSLSAAPGRKVCCSFSHLVSSQVTILFFFLPTTPLWSWFHLAPWCWLALCSRSGSGLFLVWVLCRSGEILGAAKQRWLLSSSITQ